MLHSVNPKKAGGEKEKVKPYFFVASNIIVSHNFPENFIEITQVIQKIEIFFFNINYFQ